MAERITPACAGNSDVLSHLFQSPWDHPRVCGEQAVCVPNAAACKGSPPRVRGTVAHGLHVKAGVGITPACAGNSTGKEKTLPVTWDHPRVCGEQASFSLAPSSIKGSPPRVRGTVFLNSIYVNKAGITPACAGNSPTLNPTLNPSLDHPRVCGEQLYSPSGGVKYWGSPPRVRGTGPFPLFGIADDRITPACAGNRCDILYIVKGAKDHPRVCGEQDDAIRNAPFTHGSPPRVRGTVCLGL